MTMRHRWLAAGCGRLTAEDAEDAESLLGAGRRPAKRGPTALPSQRCSSSRLSARRGHLGVLCALCGEFVAV